MSGAQMSGAQMSGAQMSGAQMSGAQMRGAQFRRAPAAVFAAAVAALIAPAAANACAVCFGSAGDNMTEGMNAGILALLGFVGLVQVGFIALFLRFRHRSKKLKEQRDSLHLIRGGLS